MQKETQKKIFEELVQQHQGILFKVARTYCQNEYDRPDLIQEIMLQLWLSFPRYNDEYKVSTWMYRISLNVAISFYRKHSPRKSHPVIIDEQLQLPESCDQAEKEQQLNLLEEFINELKPIDKALILLYLEEKNYRQISEILGISESNVATKVGRIKEGLKQKFTAIKI